MLPGNALGLARLQFAVTTATHFLFVLLTLGLVTHVAILQTRWTLTGKAVYQRMTRYWGQLYVINYALGIASGLVMEFQFGLNWSGLGETVGNVFGAPLAVETLVAFFLESTFLGAWIFGWHRLNRWVHLALIWLVAATAYASALWVMAANAFLQHPVGYQVRAGQVRLTDFAALFGNPTFVFALPHVLSAALLTGSVVMAGISACHLLRRRGPERYEFYRRSLRQAMLLAWLASMSVIGYGFPQFVVIHDHQPSKLAGGTHAAVVQAAMAARYGPGDYLPPGWVGVPLGLMIAIGFLLSLVLWLMFPLLFRDWLIKLKVPLVLLAVTIPVPFVAAVSGWLVREVGRQP